MGSRRCVGAVAPCWLRGSLSSRFCLSARAVPFDPGEPDDCTYPLVTAAFIVRAGLVRSDGLAAPTSVTRLIWVRLTLRLAPLPSRGFAGQITPSPRPIGYMANGSFQGKLLSVYETKTVSLTHRRAQREISMICIHRFPRSLCIDLSVASVFSAFSVVAWSPRLIIISTAYEGANARVGTATGRGYRPRGAAVSPVLLTKNPGRERDVGKTAHAAPHAADGGM